MGADMASSSEGCLDEALLHKPVACDALEADVVVAAPVEPLSQQQSAKGVQPQTPSTSGVTKKPGHGAGRLAMPRPSPQLPLHIVLAGIGLGAGVLLCRRLFGMFKAQKCKLSDAAERLERAQAALEVRRAAGARHLPPASMGDSY